METEKEVMRAFLGASLRGCEGGRVRRLHGFVKGAHFEPEAHSPNAEAFVRRAGSAEVEARAEELFARIRRGFGYKRRALVYSCEGGSAAIKGPDFEVVVRVGQSPEDARSYCMLTEVGGFARPEVPADATFVEVFRHCCDTLVIGFAGTLDIAMRIDALEDGAPELARYLEYPPDASSLSVLVPGAPVRLELRPEHAAFTLANGGDLGLLIDGTARLLAEFGRAGAGLVLPGLAGDIPGCAAERFPGRGEHRL